MFLESCHIYICAYPYMHSGLLQSVAPIAADLFMIGHIYVIN